MRLDIKKTNDPVLRQKTEKVEDFGIEFQSFIDDMVDTMRSYNGVGLAAPQVNNSKKVVVCEYKAEEDSKFKSFPLTVVCNPQITTFSKETKNMVEGCLSFPGLEIIVKRPKDVTISGQDRFGNKLTFKAEGLFSRVIQHEIDHLNSTLLIDYLQEIDVIFIGTGTLGLNSLEILAVDPQYNIKAVITGASTATSRKHRQIANPIEEMAKKYKLSIIKTDNINKPEVIEQIKKLKPRLGIMADFGQIISQDVIDIPKFGIINIHPSLLPKHRGPSPIQQTILDGDKRTGVSLILTGAKMDAGAIISQAIVKLRGTENTSILKPYLAEIGASLLVNSIPYYLTNDLIPTPQDDQKATYNKLFKKADGFVDKETKKEVVDRKIRAFSDWPKTYTSVKGKIVQLIAGHFEKDGTYVLDLVKPEGKNEMTYEDFKRGYHTELTFS